MLHLALTRERRGQASVIYWPSLIFSSGGTFDPSTDEIHLHKKEKTGDEDLLELAAIQPP
jgi:hypothetical protein